MLLASEGAKQQVVEEHCAGCWLFEERGRISDKLACISAELNHGEYDEMPVGKWDFETCFNTGCWKKEKKRQDYDKVKQLDRYRKLHPEAKYRNKIPVTYVGIQKLLPNSNGLKLVNLPNGSTVVYNPNQHEIVEVK